jgi:hypothetical protein
MAHSIGSLVVRLGLDAAEFATGLTKSEADAKRFAKQLDAGIATAATAAGIAIGAITVAAGAAFAAVDQLAKQASKFKDFEEITGASAEGLASFAVSAGTAGTAMETIASASVKLTKSLTGVDDDSKAAGAALEALGLPIKEFKALKPEDQIEAVAKALGGFEDGAQKTAVAVALFGKAGAELLPFLKQLNEDGGRQVILTQQQIEAADAYADRQARLKTLISLYGQAIVTEALGPMDLFVRSLTESITKTNSLGETIKTFASDGTFKEWFNDAARAVARSADVLIDWVNAFKITIGIVTTGAEQIAGLGQQFRGLDRITKGDFKAGAEDIAAGFNRMTSAGGKWVASLRDAANRTSVLTTLNQKLADESHRSAEDRGFKPQRPTLNFNGPAPNTRATAERQSDAERYLATLQKQLEATFELSTVEKVTLDIMSGRLKLSNGVTEEQLLAIAREIDAYKARIEAGKELARTLEAEARAREQAGKIERQVLDAAVKDRDRLVEGNQALKDEIAIILGGVVAQKAIEKARVSSAIALKEEALAAEQSVNGNTALAQALQDQINVLKERQGLLGQKDFAEAIAADAQRIKDINQSFADSFSSNVVDVINGTKTMKDALKSFEKDVVSIISRIAANNIAKALFGGQDGAGAFDFGKIIQSLLGSFGGGTPTGFAEGGNPPVGKSILVGENGPEIIRPRVASTILPNEAFRSMAMAGGPAAAPVNIFMPQGTSRASASQVGAAVARKQHADAKRNL